MCTRTKTQETINKKRTMGLTDFWTLFKDDGHLAASVVPTADRGKIIADTDVVFIDTAFLLTTGSLKLGTSKSFMYYSDQADQNFFDNMPPHTRLPLTLGDCVIYVVEFIKRIVKTRPSVKHIIFGVDNHMHVPITKRATWADRDFGQRDTLHEPYSRSDKTLHFELMTALLNNTGATRQEPIGKSISFTTSLLTNVLTDRYTRPLFISLLFQGVAAALNNYSFDNRALTIFVMHPIVDFVSKKYMENKWSFKDGNMTPMYCTDGLAIGEADIQLLWVLHSMRMNKYTLEFFANDSDNIMIALLHLCHMNRVTPVFGASNNMLMWMSDERVIDVVKLYNIIPVVFESLQLQGMNTATKTRHWCLKFIELCMLVYKTDYYHNIMGVTSSTPSLNRIIKHLSKLPHRFIVTSPIEFTYVANDWYPTAVTFNHAHLMEMHYYVIQLSDLTSIQKVKAAQIADRPPVMTPAVIAEYWEKFLTGINTPRSGSIGGDFAYLVDAFNMSNNVKQHLGRIYNIEQFISFAQGLASAYTGTPHPFESDHTGITSNATGDTYAMFVHTPELLVKPVFTGRQLGDADAFMLDVAYPVRAETTISAANKERARNFDALFNLRTKNGLVFPGEYTKQAQSSRSAMIEWVICYWTWGHGRLFDPTGASAIKTDRTLVLNDGVLKVRNTRQLSDLLMVAGYDVQFTENRPEVDWLRWPWPTDEQDTINANILTDMSSVEVSYIIGNDDNREPINFARMLGAMNITLYPELSLGDNARRHMVEDMMNHIKLIHGMRAVSILTTYPEITCDIIKSFCKNAFVCTVDGTDIQLSANANLLFIKHVAAYISKRNATDTRVLESLDNITIARGTKSPMVFIPVIVQRRIYPFTSTGIPSGMPTTYQFAQIPHIVLTVDDNGKDGTTPVYREVLFVNDTNVTSGIISSKDNIANATLLYYKTLSYLAPENGRVIEQHGVLPIKYAPLVEYTHNFMYNLQDPYILSGSLDVCSYALPLLGGGISRRTWYNSFAGIMHVFREYMEASFQSAMEFKLVESMYLDYLVKSKIRENHDVKWLVTYTKQKKYTFFAREFLTVYINNPHSKYADFGLDISKCIAPVTILAAVPPSTALTWPIAALMGNNIFTIGTADPDTEQMGTFMQHRNTVAVIKKLSQLIPNIQGLYCSLSEISSGAVDAAAAADGVTGVITADLYFDRWPKHIFFLYVYKIIADMYVEFGTDNMSIEQFYSNPLIIVERWENVFVCKVNFNYIVK